jgi:hypothetical protein
MPRLNKRDSELAEQIELEKELMINSISYYEEPARYVAASIKCYIYGPFPTRKQVREDILNNWESPKNLFKFYD